ncbi:hypothetical protein Gpo141_00007344 [Globisporangium polare]
MTQMLMSVLQRAAECGSIEVLRWIRWKYPTVKWKGVLNWAAERSQLDSVQWIAERYPDSATPNTVGSAASSGDLVLLRWVSERFPAPDFCTPRKAMQRAAATGKLEIVEYLHRERGIKTTGAAESAAEHGFLHILEWLYDSRSMATSPNHTWAPPKAVALAAKSGHLGCLEYLAHRLPKKFLRGAVDGAAERGHLHILQWLNTRSKVRVSREALRKVAQNGHVDVLKWLYETSPRYFRNRFGLNNMNLLEEATAHGRVDMVEWMLEVGEDLENCIVEAIAAAEENGDSDVEGLLREHAEAIGGLLLDSDEDYGGAFYGFSAVLGFSDASDFSDYGYGGHALSDDNTNYF